MICAACGFDDGTAFDRFVEEHGSTVAPDGREPPEFKRVLGASTLLVCPDCGAVRVGDQRPIDHDEDIQARARGIRPHDIPLNPEDSP